MVSIREILISLGEAKLQEFIGPSCFRLISRIDEHYLSIGMQADLVSKRYGESILLDRKIRSELLEALRREDAQELAMQVFDCVSSNPYSQLLAASYRQGSSELATLYDFFNLSEPVPIEKDVLPSTSECTSEYGLYDYQRDAVSSAINFLDTKLKRVLIHMPTGAGKTRSTMYLISRYAQRYSKGFITVWLAHSEELCDQAANEFAKCWKMHGDRAVSLGRFYGPYETDIDSFEEGMIIASLQKLYSRSLSQQTEFLKLKNKVSLVVLDEAHQATAPTYKHLLSMLSPHNSSSALLGLSATPGRSAVYIDETEELAELFHRQKVTLKVPGYPNPFEYLQETGYLAKPNFEFINHNTSVKLSDQELKSLADGFDIPDRVIEELTEDDQRNLILLKKIMNFSTNPENKIIIFAASVAHAKMLADILVIKGIRAASVSSYDAPQERKQNIASFKSTDANALQILVNYGVLTTGFDAPKTNVAIIARPTQSVVLYSQMIGRAMRGILSGGNETCTIVTLVDNIPGFKNIYEGFKYWDPIW